MRALSVRQPFAELILRGIKTIEYRSRPTRIVGERFWIYAAMGQGARGKGQVWSQDLGMPSELPGWMLELAEQIKLIPADLQGGLPRGVIVGSAVVERVSPIDGVYGWHLAQIERASKLRKPKHQPQPVWFKPF